MEELTPNDAKAVLAASYVPFEQHLTLKNDFLEREFFMSVWVDKMRQDETKKLEGQNVF